MIGGDDEWEALLQRDAEPREVGGVDAAPATSGDEAIDVLGAEAGDAEEDFSRGAVHIDGEIGGMAQGPRELRIDIEAQVGRGGVGDFVDLETVEAEQPIGLVEPV